MASNIIEVELKVESTKIKITAKEEFFYAIKECTTKCKSLGSDRFLISHLVRGVKI
jgi:hypothetical protein